MLPPVILMHRPNISHSESQPWWLYSIFLVMIFRGDFPEIIVLRALLLAPLGPTGPLMGPPEPQPARHSVAVPAARWLQLASALASLQAFCLDF